MLNNSRKYSTLVASFSSRSASLVAWASLAFFAASGSDASQRTQYAFVRYAIRGNNNTTINNGPIVARYYRLVNGPGFPPVLEMFPFLSGLSSYYVTSSGYTVYHQSKYTSSNWPWAYSYVASYGNGPDVPDDWTATDLDDIVNKPSSEKPLNQRAALTGFIAYSVDHGDGSITKSAEPIYRATGQYFGDTIVLNDNEGRPVLVKADSNGIASGYINDGLELRPVFYDMSGTTPVEISPSQTTQSEALTYNPDTGLYTFTPPDYSPQLQQINDSILSLQNQTITIDNIELDIPPPQVTVNPEITVNPPAVTVNPEITVNPPEVNVSVDTDLSEVNDGLSAVNDSLDAIAESFYTPAIDSNFSNEVLTDEENALLNVVHGWETDIPVLGDAMDIGLNVLIGKIPQIDKKYELLNTELWGYQVKCDLNAYKDTIMLFRAFFLLCELVWFFWVLWNDIHKALQV